MLVIDTPGWTDERTVERAHSSHMTVLPSKPTMEDLVPTIRLQDRMEKAGVPRERIAIAFNEVLRESEVVEAREFLAKAGGKEALDGFLRTMKSYRDARATGRAVTETTLRALNNEGHKLIDGIMGRIETMANALSA
ncbi:MAG: ParA family protein, partial [Alphaproteobacteria bacterium]|nr:ParA family protein [Alphaproteobacteria bacterium]